MDKTCFIRRLTDKGRKGRKVKSISSGVLSRGGKKELARTPTFKVRGSSVELAVFRRAIVPVGKEEPQAPTAGVRTTTRC